MAMIGDHLSPAIREMLDKPLDERIAYIQMDSWIPYSQANKILEHLDGLLKHPKCDRMPNCAISAQTNNGKTRLIKHFLSLHQAHETPNGMIAAPVFYVQCPSIPDESRLYSAILMAHEAVQEIPHERTRAGKTCACARRVVKDRHQHPRNR
jgi:hypothetical protein